MRLAEEEADVAAQEFSYRNWQIDQLSQVAAKSDRFAKERAAENIKALAPEMQQFQARTKALAVGNVALDTAVGNNQRQLGLAMQQVEQIEKSAKSDESDSRNSLSNLYNAQQQSRAFNVANAGRCAGECSDSV